MRDEGNAVQAHEQEMHRHDESVMSALRGPWKDDSVGHVRDETQGVVYQVGELWKESKSGKRRGLPMADRAAIWVAVATVVAHSFGIEIPKF